MSKSGVDVDALVARAAISKYVCWFARIEDETTQAYVTMLEHMEAKAPQSVNREEVYRTIRMDLVGNVSLGVIKKHFRGVCTCGQT